MDYVIGVGDESTDGDVIARTVPGSDVVSALFDLFRWTGGEEGFWTPRFGDRWIGVGQKLRFVLADGTPTRETWPEVLLRRFEPGPPNFVLLAPGGVDVLYVVEPPIEGSEQYARAAAAAEAITVRSLREFGLLPGQRETEPGGYRIEPGSGARFDLPRAKFRADGGERRPWAVLRTRRAPWSIEELVSAALAAKNLEVSV